MARRPVIPRPVRDLEARQQGDFIVLRFTLPTQSTRNEALAETPAIEIYRGATVNGEAPEKGSPRLLYTIPSEMADSYMENGRIVFRDRIEPSGPGAQASAAMVYEVRTRVERNRASAESNRVAVRTFAPPGAVAGVRAEVNGGAIALEWTPAGQAPAAAGTGEYRVYRAEITPESAAEAASDASKAILLSPLQMLEQVAEPRYRDSGFEWGHTYLYVVRQAARFDSDTVESADSNPAVITPTQGTPPAAPDVVEAVMVPASEQAAAYVSLSWSISAEAEVAGYNVYRSDDPEAPGAKLNDAPLGAPTYRDSSVAPGRQYFYRVTAVDEAGRESEMSAAAGAQIPAQQP
jgi:hypothetical protein